MLAKAASGKLMTKLIREKAFYVQQWEAGIKTEKQHPKGFQKICLYNCSNPLKFYWVFSVFLRAFLCYFKFVDEAFHLCAMLIKMWNKRQREVVFICKWLNDMINLPINQYLCNAPIWWPGERETFLIQVRDADGAVYMYVHIYIYTEVPLLPIFLSESFLKDG